MSRLFVPNFSFEQELQGSFTPSAIVQRFEAELAFVWLAVAEDGDEILCPVSIEPDDWRRMRELGCAEITPLSVAELDRSQAVELVPWGWSRTVRELAKRLSISPNAPMLDVVIRVNSREFTSMLESEQGIQLPGARLCRSLPEVHSHLSNHENVTDWILKTNLSQAGRGQLRVSGAQLSPTQTAWVQNRLAEERLLVVEPKLEKVLEIGCQWDISRAGPQLLAVTELISDDAGNYRGSRLIDRCKTHLPSDVSRLIESIISQQELAIQRVQSAGYFGPVGIDAMIYSKDGSHFARSLQDINARWTMGRLAWEWSHRLEPMAHVEGIPAWIHGREQPTPTAICLSPETIGGIPVQHRTWWTVLKSTP